MLMHMWRAPNQRFPNDDQWLARKFRRSVECVKTDLRPLIAEFFQTDGNWLYHKRIAKEFTYVASKSQKQSDRAKARWNNEKVECRGNAPTPTPFKKERKKDSPAGAGTVAYRWSGKIVHLNELDFARWAEAFHTLDLQAHLLTIDEWLAGSEATDAKRKGWFHLVGNALRKRHEEALAVRRLAESRPRVREGVGVGILA
jgi:hypothetical protein